ncbi:MAG: hypothetical protein R3C03_17380 [Pirellulaceae bacterium]
MNSILSNCLAIIALAFMTGCVQENTMTNNRNERFESRNKLVASYPDVVRWEGSYLACRVTDQESLEIFKMNNHLISRLWLDLSQVNVPEELKDSSCHTLTLYYKGEPKIIDSQLDKLPVDTLISLRMARDLRVSETGFQHVLKCKELRKISFRVTDVDSLFERIVEALPYVHSLQTNIPFSSADIPTFEKSKSLAEVLVSGSQLEWRSENYDTLVREYQQRISDGLLDFK